MPRRPDVKFGFRGIFYSANQDKISPLSFLSGGMNDELSAGPQYRDTGASNFTGRVRMRAIRA